jgi:hypothetical protein
MNKARRFTPHFSAVRAIGVDPHGPIRTDLQYLNGSVRILAATMATNDPDPWTRDRQTDSSGKHISDDVTEHIR